MKHGAESIRRSGHLLVGGPTCAPTSPRSICHSGNAVGSASNCFLVYEERVQPFYMHASIAEWIVLIMYLHVFTFFTMHQCVFSYVSSAALWPQNSKSLFLNGLKTILHCLLKNRESARFEAWCMGLTKGRQLSFWSGCWDISGITTCFAVSLIVSLPLFLARIFSFW